MKTLTIIAIYMFIATGVMAQAPAPTASGKYRSVEPIAFKIEKKGKPVSHQIQQTAIKPVIPVQTEQTATGQLNRKDEEDKLDKAIASKE